MDLIRPSRRSFLTGLAAAFAAPAIVRAGSLMPVRTPPVDLRPRSTGELFVVTDIEPRHFNGFREGGRIHLSCLAIDESARGLDVRLSASDLSNVDIADRVMFETVQVIGQPRPHRLIREASFDCDFLTRTGLLVGDIISIEI